jgi:uncharacterized membrane protein
MAFLRFLLLLSLIVWLGGIIFFAAVMAPTLFAVLPTRNMAGSVVGPTLSELHWIGLFCGLIFLACSVLHEYFAQGDLRLFSVRHTFVVLMIVLTAISLFVLTPKMTAIKEQIGIIDNVPVTDPQRVHFNALHVWSTRVESAVLLLGLGVVFSVARQREW